MLETSRLLCSRFTRDDRDAVHALHRHADVMRFIGDGRPWPPDEIDAELEQLFRRDPPAPWVGRLAVRLRTEPEVVGWALLDEWENTGVAEVGFGLFPELHGRGLGRELAQALVARGRSVDAEAPLVATVHPRNTASVHVLQGLGFARCGVAHREGRTKDLYALGDPDLLEAQHRGLVDLL